MPADPGWRSRLPFPPVTLPRRGNVQPSDRFSREMPILVIDRRECTPQACNRERLPLVVGRVPARQVTRRIGRSLPGRSSICGTLCKNQIEISLG